MDLCNRGCVPSNCLRPAFGRPKGKAKCPVTWWESGILPVRTNILLSVLNCWHDLFHMPPGQWSRAGKLVYKLVVQIGYVVQPLYYFSLGLSVNYPGGCFWDKTLIDRRFCIRLHWMMKATDDIDFKKCDVLGVEAQTICVRLLMSPWSHVTYGCLLFFFTQKGLYLKRRQELRHPLLQPCPIMLRCLKPFAPSPAHFHYKRLEKGLSNNNAQWSKAEEGRCFHFSLQYIPFRAWVSRLQASEIYPLVWAELRSQPQNGGLENHNQTSNPINDRGSGRRWIGMAQDIYTRKFGAVRTLFGFWKRSKWLV